MTTRLVEILEAAAEEGFLTAAGAADGVEHSNGFLGPDTRGLSLTPGATDLAVDLGTGGGLPGLVLASRTEARWVLVERSARRCRFLKWALRELGLETRVQVKNKDARDLAQSTCRGRAVFVSARSFGSPPVTAEIGAAFLKVGGALVVSEPPRGEGAETLERWPSVGISQLGLTDKVSWNRGRFSYRALSCISLTPDRFPRRGPAMISEPLF